MWTIVTGQSTQLATGGRPLVSDLLEHCENSDYSNLFGEYSYILEEFKGIAPQCDTEHHIDLIYPQKSPLKPRQYRLS